MFLVYFVSCVLSVSVLLIATVVANSENALSLQIIMPGISRPNTGDNIKAL